MQYLGFLAFKPIDHELSRRSPILWIHVGDDYVHLLGFASTAPQEAICQLLHQSTLLLSSSALEHLNTNDRHDILSLAFATPTLQQAENFRKRMF